MDEELIAQYAAREDNYWWAEVRWKIVDSLLKKIKLPNKEETCIADIGCGTGFYAQRLQCYGKVTGVDPSPISRLYAANRSINVLPGNAENLPFSDNSLNLIISLDVLEHLENDSFALREFRRVLKPGGFLLVSVPAFSFLWTKRDKELKHYRRYRKSQLRAILLDEKYVIKCLFYAFFALIPPLLCIKLKELFIKNKSKSDLSKGGSYAIESRWLNSVIGKYFKLERCISNTISLPGTTLFCLAQVEF